MLGPNIKGYFSVKNNTQFLGITSGAFNIVQASDSSTERVNASVVSAYTPNRTQLNASLFNSTYTDSGKVYPLSLALNFIIKC
ncbi:hypothetical protein [Succinivibrio dextrinosolvens]|uniref:Uncharacterized protein n=1 Tax=Succinivibrio dextrinosolvens TaxID=83771 RepID=A0A662Z5U0_9GAMM|nr:hypothetical protein [Succinivibrio dextrinosolvens]SFJ73861.1 hypothetical protein SAMN04487865_100199 [Succinivibrio dextrinosolvens]